MCGIVGYYGINSALPRLLDGLARLEYRGYDSAGVSLALDTGLATYKTRGRLSSLKALLEKEKPLETKLGIGHTRWANLLLSTPTPIWTPGAGSRLFTMESLKTTFPCEKNWKD